MSPATPPHAPPPPPPRPRPVPPPPLAPPPAPPPPPRPRRPGRFAAALLAAALAAPLLLGPAAAQVPDKGKGLKTNQATKRNNGSAGVLTGSVCLFNLFVDDKESSWTKQERDAV